MAKRVLTAAHLTLNSVDISAACKKIELSLESDAQDVTTYGSAGWKEFLGGLKSGELSIEFLNDYDDSAIDDDLFAIFGTVVTFAIRADQAAAGASNPEYTGSVLIKDHKPLQGSVGDAAAASVSFPTSGAVARGEGA